MPPPDVPARSLPPHRGRPSATVGLACLAASLLAVNAAFVLWPDVSVAPDVVPSEAPPSEAIVLEFVDPTRQPPPPANLPLGPPPPVESELPPEEVPDDRVVEEIVRDLEIPLPAVERATTPAAPPPMPGPITPPAPPGLPAPAPPSNRIVERPERSPRLVRASLPVYPPAAQREGVRARAAVRVLISEGGQVETATIIERVILDRRGNETAVRELPFGLEAAALDAARRHLFRPARDDGDRVRAYAVISLSFDPPR